LTPAPDRSRARQGTDVVIGAAAAVVVFAAVPTVLVALVGVPLPHSWGRHDVVSLRGLFDVLALAAWLAWAVCCWSLLRSVAARVRHRNATAAGEGRLSDWLAARIAAAVLAVAAVNVAVGTAAGPSSSPPAAAQVTTEPGPGATVATLLSAPTGATAPATGPDPETTTTSTAPPPGDAAVPDTYTVQAGDTLWTIAERFYGDGADWAAIAQANLGDLMDDGWRFTDPNLIVPGWILTLPDPSGPAPQSDPVPAAPPTSVDRPPAPPAAATASASSSAPFGTGTGTGAAGSHVRQGAPRHHAHRRRRGVPVPPAVPLPELSALGLGTLAAAALARRARRRRQLASLSPDEKRASPMVSDLAADAAALLAPFDGVPMLDVLESANRHLAAALADLGGRVDVPTARLVRIGPAGVDVRLAGPVHWAPPGWHLRDSHSWHLPASTDPALLQAASAGHDPWLPLLVPVGENEEGTWLVPLVPGSCLPVLGSGAGSMVTAMRLAAASWSWSEDVMSSDDAATVETALATGFERAPADGTPPGPARRPVAGPSGVLYVGDPATLSPQARGRCAVLTVQPALASDLTVVVDHEAASIHPLGITVRPQLLDEPRCRAIEELVNAPTSGTGDALLPRRASASPQTGVDLRPSPPSLNGREHLEAPTIADSLLPGQVEVRLLTAFPRMDGLIEELPAKRSRRATELVAYLAVHRPDPVTSDRLRTRVLGSATTDAAAKTLFNTVGAARRAMGRDMFGDPLLPPATKSGTYGVSALVTVDALRAGALIAAAASAAHDDEEMAMLRAGLELVEGEPMAGALTGYAWWSVEGHERRVAAELVDGACRLARLAVRHGHVDLARWGIDRARLVDPYSEVLSQAAMRLAAETADADRLRYEWAECQRRADELEPGSLPSEATEALYLELRQRLTAGSNGALPGVLKEAAERDDGA
jgi:LysM repeat protein/DNA-binding SARP family transcriptional activator